MMGMTVVLLGRAHYVLYYLKRRNRFSVLMTWGVTIAIVGFWGWRFLLGSA